MTKDRAQAARTALAGLTDKLRTHAQLSDPAEIAEHAGDLIAEVTRELAGLLAYLHEHTSGPVGLSTWSLRDLLLAGDTVLVDFIAPDGIGRIAVALDPEEPVTLARGGELTAGRWASLTAVDRGS